MRQFAEVYAKIFEMPQNFRRKAILLISMMLISLVVLIFVQACFALAPSALARSSNEIEKSSASRAAQSGLTWVRQRLSGDRAWCANSTTLQSFAGNGLQVQEGMGQVVGWMRDGESWSRFRVRFNYQDGGPAGGTNSDNQADPPQPWSDFPYVSCNNLMGASQCQLPLAGDASRYLSVGPWPGPAQLAVPPGSVLVSVEGSSGRCDDQNPDHFYGKVHRRTIQTLLKLSSHQPVTDAAVSSAGHLQVDLMGGTLQLQSLSAEPARLRSKDQLTVGAVNSTGGELRAAGTIANGTLTNVTTAVDSAADGFYKIPASKVRTPSAGLTLPAGTYVVTASNTILYYPMNYADFATTSPPPAGTPVTLPAGMTLEGPLSSTPRFRLSVQRDLAIQAVGATRDFALIPDGGAPQSDTYGGLAATAAPAPAASDDFATWLAGPSAPNIAPDTQAMTAWIDLLGTLGQGSDISADLNYDDYWLTTDHSSQAQPHIAIPRSSTSLPILTNCDTASLMAAFQLAGPDKVAALLPFYPTYLSPAPAPSSTSASAPSPPPLLSPSDVELRLQDPAHGGITLANSQGSIILGSQIQGHGAAIVSARDISLIGTSSELSSTPGQALGLNLYAQGTITVDAFKLDAISANFRNFSMQGILYAWRGINILAGNSSSHSRFQLTGEMVAYGGDPSGPSLPGAASTTIRANESSITFDPSYVAGLLQNGPFSFEVLAWHEF